MATKISVNSIQNPVSPNIPIAPVEYSQSYQDQFSNILRLYFNLVNNNLNGLVLPSIPSSPAGLRSGSIWYDPSNSNVIKYVP